MQASDQALCEALSLASGERFGKVLEVSSRASFPLRMMIAERFAQDRVALIGDSAHVVHPLAGQGLNLGLRDVRNLMRIVKGRGGLADDELS